jgi:RimJ/RimL family protein N-acetyltransferase
MNPILIDLPMPILTPRLLIRPTQAGDGKQANEATVESIAELKPWMPWAQKEIPTVEDSEENNRRSMAEWILRTDLRLHLFDRVSGRYVGGSGLHRMKWEIPSFEIGYWIRTSEANKGLITEATNAVARYAFTQLKAKRVEIRCNSRNEKSARIAVKLGFDLEGTLRNTEIQVGREPGHTLVFAMLSPEKLPPLEVKW